MTRNRRGFTLIEALIAITVLLMLSAVTIFSTLNMIASAEANNIITNMIHIKAAVLMWYKENSSRLVPQTDGDYKIKTKGTEQFLSGFVDSHSSEILKYLDNKTSFDLHNKNSGTKTTGDYSLIATNKSAQWYVCYNLGKIEENTDMEAPNVRIRSKLAGNSKTYGLLGKSALNNDNFGGLYTDQQYACMLVLQLHK